MPDYPSIPFRNAYSGPAGEYSDAYKAIVDQYRDEVDSAQNLRRFQEDERAVNTGLVPPSVLESQSMRGFRGSPALRAPQTFKSRNDLVQIDPATGQPRVIYSAPPVPLTPMRPPAPYTSPFDAAKIHSARIGFDSAQRAFDKASKALITNPSDADAQQARIAAMEELRRAQEGLNASKPVATPALNPPPGLTIPQTATATTPAYTPAPMMDAGEIAPPGSIVMGRRNALAAPPSTTQNPTRVLDADTAKQILAKVNGDKAKARELAVQLGYSLK